MSPSNLVCYLYFSPTGYKLEVAMTSSSGLINLPEWLTEVREMFYLADYQFIRNEYKPETARWNRCTGQGTVRVQSCHASPSLCVHQQEAPQTQSFRVFINPSCLLPSQRSGSETES